MQPSLKSAAVFFAGLFLSLFAFDVVRTVLFTSPGDHIAHFKMGGWFFVLWWRIRVFAVIALVLSLCHFLAAVRLRRRVLFPPDYPRAWSVLLGCVSAGLFLLLIWIVSFYAESHAFNSAMDFAAVRLLYVMGLCLLSAYVPSLLGLRYLTRPQPAASAMPL